MGWEGWVVSGLVVMLVFGLARELASPPRLFMGAFVALAALSPTSPRFPAIGALLGAFGNEALATIAALFVLSAGVARARALARVAAWLGRPRTTAG
ncbi:MAG TPA: SLC13 family permease, partial [Myxococcales bacterium]|nr:SLC13 family permease [Myxococcales bacterium]